MSSTLPGAGAVRRLASQYKQMAEATILVPHRPVKDVSGPTRSTREARSGLTHRVTHLAQLLSEGSAGMWRCRPSGRKVPLHSEDGEARGSPSEPAARGRQVAAMFAVR
jgi:hypothetical protein